VHGEGHGIYDRCREEKGDGKDSAFTVWFFGQKASSASCGVSMATLTLVSTRDHPLQPLVEAALTNELRLLEASMQRTGDHLLEFEQTHHMTTAEFVSRYENDELPETLEFAEWMGEYRLLARLQEKAETVREIQFAH
jgi:hypothetical protein